MSTQAKADLHALFTDAYVAIANRGRPFTCEGVRAVCQAHLSPKRERSGTPIADEADAERLLCEIRKQRLDAYKACPSDLMEDGGAEDVLRSEYAGRILPELMQNAHDAIASQPIGSKGVGFKAVINVCKGPRIHSGPLHCGFDRQRSLTEFKSAGLVGDNASVPLMRLPFPVSEADEPQPVRDLIANYDTVVVLPFIDESARKRFLEEWNDYSVDATLLLFLSAVDSIVWEQCDGDETSIQVWRRKRRGAVVEIYDGEAPTPKKRWHLWTSGRASIAIRLDGEGALAPEPSCPNIRVFFETEERSPLPILIHADFPLKEGRANVLIDDEAGRTGVAEVTAEAACLVRDALAGIDDAGLLLDLLKPRVEPEEMGRLERKLWASIKEQIVTLEIPGAAGLRLDEARLRPTGEGHESSWWWLDCDLWSAFKKVLAEHRVGGLSELSFLPPGVDTEEREKTLLHFNPSAVLTVAEFRSLPLLPVEANSDPVAPSQSVLFFPAKETPPAPPAGVEVRFLGQQFVKAIKNHDRHDDLKKLLTEVCGVSDFTPLALVEKAILPVLRSGKQPDGLLDFLCEVVVPVLKTDDLVFDWRNPVRRELAERLLIPLRDGALLPAAQVYAGAEWTRDDFLERAYGDRSDRGFLHPPPDDGQEQGRWEKFYRWVGVGWCPKVLPIVCFAGGRETFEGPTWNNNIFPVQYPPEYWPEYCGTLIGFEDRSRRPRLRQNWTLDGGSEVLRRDGAYSVVKENWAHYKNFQNAIYYRSSNLRLDLDNERKAGPSHLLWLFRTSTWIPVKGISEYQNPEDVFARAEIVRDLGGWAYELDGDADGDFLKAIGVRSGWRQLDDKDWHRWLRRSTELSCDTLNQDLNWQGAVYSLYHAALRHWKGKDESPHKSAGSWRGAVWSIERRGDNTETWRLTDRRDDVYFVDRPELDEIRIPGLWIFPVRLNRLEEAAQERFHVKLLSEHLQGEPDRAAPVEPAAQAIRQRLDDAARLGALNAYLQVAGAKNPSSIEKLKLPEVPEIKVVNKLTVRFRLPDRVLSGGVKLDAYHARDDNGWTLWLDGGLFDGEGKPARSVWDYVASALVYAGDLPLDAQPCLKDLLEYEGADLERKLLNLGVTGETIRQIIPPRPQPPNIETGEDTGSAGPGPEPEPPLPGNGTGEQPHPPRPAGGGSSHGNGGDKRGTGGGGGTGRSSPDDRPGHEAEEWMRSELRTRLEGEGWQVSDAPTHDEELRETDIELDHSEFGTFHVEVKHCESDIVYWSENEVEKAKRNPKRYLMVILRRRKEKGFAEYWISNPLEQLENLKRTGAWEWRGRQEGVDVPRTGAPWEVPKPKPERPASSFSFKIEVGREWLTNQGQGFETIRKYLQTTR